MSHPSLAALSGAAAGLLIANKQTVSVAESSCGGLISAALVAVPGASAFYIGGGVIYTAKGGKTLLPERPKGMQSATQAFALFEARAIREKMGATWGIGETGASGPSGNPYGNPPGHACIAVSGPIERVITLATGNADREANMWAFAKAALDLLADLAAQ
ncbi:MAG: CinA family protein [Alphaproteobacteria bacterium]|nr:CinA family protein [Alphaproteobacteria bacterium]